MRTVTKPVTTQMVTVKLLNYKRNIPIFEGQGGVGGLILKGISPIEAGIHNKTEGLSAFFEW